MRRLLVLSALAALFVAVPAVAQQPPGTPPATPPQTTPPPAPPAAGGHLKIVAEGIHAGTALTGRRWSVRGAVEPYVAGQRTLVRFFRGTKKLKTRRVAVVRAPGGGGRFRVAFRTIVAGRVRVEASKLASPQQIALTARRTSVLVLRTYAGLGARGAAVALLQHELRARGYVPGRLGLYDARTSRAVLAFRKVTGMPRTYVADRRVFYALERGAGHFGIRYPGHGRHVEADLSRQVVALVRGRRAERIYSTSSGKPSTPTVLGHYRFYSKLPGFNAEGMYFSNFFIRGYAIHGYHDVPVYNASHGCLRVSLADARAIYARIRIGERIDVYR